MEKDPYRFIPPPYYTNFFIRKANDNEEDNPTEEYDDGRYLKKHYERKEKYYSKDQSYYKGKNYNEYDRGYYGNKSSSNYHEDKDYYESERNKTSFNYKERERKNYDKGYDAGKKSYGTKPKGKGNTSGQGQKYYYEPKQLKDDPENFPPLIVKEGALIFIIIIIY